MSNKKRIGYIFLGPFPVGNVSTLRVMSYCKALRKDGHHVKVYILAPTHEARVNSTRKGIYDGVEYEYLTRITWKKPKTNISIKLIYYFIGIVIMTRLISKDKLDVVLTYHSELALNSSLRFLTKLKGIPFILDKTEYPKNRNKSLNIEGLKLKFFDGIITISNELKTYYEKFNKNVFLLPMTIDPERYKGVKITDNNDFITVVFGTHGRDCLVDSVLGFIEFLKISSNQTTKLRLIGDFLSLSEKHPANKEIFTIINENNATDRVVFEGIIPNNEIPALLKNSKLLMTTPREFISGGFPTKLGEYLLSEVPVVATKVGELENYLNDKEIYFVDPQSPKQIGDTIKQVFMNEKVAKEIGQNGAKKARSSFNAESYIDALNVFFDKLKS